MRQKIASRIIGNVEILPATPQQVAREFRALLADNRRLIVPGQAREEPLRLLHTGYTPKYAIELFGVRIYLCNQRNAQGLKVIPAFVAPLLENGRPGRGIYARVFYKDSSLVWRSASHYINTPDEHWIGKGAVRWQQKHGSRGWFSAEETTNLPFELQEAMDQASQRNPRRQNDNRLLSLVLRNAPSNRVHPYDDFERPRLRAMQSRGNRVNNGRRVAWFEDDRDPRSLRFEPGYEPDFRAPVDVSASRSTMYGGAISKYRFASRNRIIQYLFVAGPRHVWIVNPQTFTVDLSTYGLRTIDVVVDEDLCIPGYEFHDNRGTGEIDSQIPAGFAGEECPLDPDRADASPWNDKMPVVRAFRRFLARKRHNQ